MKKKKIQQVFRKRDLSYTGFPFEKEQRKFFDLGKLRPFVDLVRCFFSVERDNNENGQFKSREH